MTRDASLAYTASASGRSAPIDGTDRLHALIADVQPHARMYARELLEQAGVTRISEEADGFAVVERLADPGAGVDVLFLDLQLPVMDGVEVLRALSNRRIATPVVLLSGLEGKVLGAAAALAQGMNTNVIGVLAKPLSREKVTLILDRLRGADTPETDALPSVQELETLYDAGAFRVDYAPQLQVVDGRYAGSEAVLHCEHPTHGGLSADLLLRAVDQSAELSALLSGLLISEALETSRRAPKLDREHPITVRLFPRALASDMVPASLVAHARQYGLGAANLMIAIPERAIDDDAARVLEVATRLRLSGYLIALDEYGTGATTLRSLSRMPFGQLRIASRFVDGCSESPEQLAVVKSALQLARIHRIGSVACGVRQRPDWDLLTELSCDLAQGSFLARSMTALELWAWAEQWALRA
jgi:EAL domain-containing protein (putative c-di-GMP-specific phosphodiesterase class I)